jgi:hypothetical protein
MNNSYETFDLEMSGEKIKSLLDFLSNNIDPLKDLIKIISDINDIKNATTIDGGKY